MIHDRRLPAALRSWRTFSLIGLCALGGTAQAQDLSYDGGKGSALIFENQIKISASVPSTYFGMIGNAWGYGGIQMNQDTLTKSAIFSIWDQAEETTEYAYNATLDIRKHGRFGGEGTGAQFLFNNNWKVGTLYRVAYRVFPEADGTHLRLSGFYYDGDLRTWTYVVTYRANTGGKTLPTDQFYAFTENYGNTWGDRTADLSNAWMYQAGTGWKDLTSGWVFNIPPGDQPSQTSRPDFGEILTAPDGFTIHSDTNPATRTQAEWAPVAYTPTAAELPIVIPYYLSCGNASAQGNWEPDGYWKDGAGDSTNSANPAPVDTSNVRDPAPQAVYQNARKGSQFQYNLIGFLPNEDYWVRLHFVEDTYDKAGARRENVTINGETVLKAFDIFRHAGGRNQAVAKGFRVKADALGQINIQFAHAPGSMAPDASVCAITATPERPDFRLEAGTPVAVMRGFGAATQETVVSLNGFSTPTRLRLFDLPCGVTAKLTPDPLRFLTGSNTVSTTLTLEASPCAWPVQNWEARLLASSEGEERVIPIRITVQDPVPTFIQANESPYADSGTTVQANFPGAQVQGDLNVLAVQWQDATANIASVTDTSGNTYHLAAGPTRNPDQPGSQAIYYATGIRAANAGANAVTVTFDSTAAAPDLLVADYAGVRTLDQAVSATGSTVTLDSGPVLLKTPGELLFSAANVAWWVNSPGDGFTQRFQSDWGNIIQDQVAATAGTYHATAVQNGGAPWIIQMVTFK